MTQKYTLEAIKTKSQNVKGALGRRAQGGNIKNSMCNRSIPSPFGIIFLRLYTISHKKSNISGFKDMERLRCLAYIQPDKHLPKGQKCPQTK